MRRAIWNPLGMLLTGLLLGAVSRWLDGHTQNLGNIFSQLAIWILLGVLISIYSRTKKQAMGNMLAFCAGMLLSYYLAAVLTKGVYGGAFILGWTGGACVSPVLAYFAWMTKERGIFPRVISAGIVLASLLSSVILFDGPRVYDLVIDGALVYLLFCKKVER